MDKPVSYRTVLILLAPLVLYGVAINPYFMPGQYDDILYYYGAKSLLEHGSFQFHERYITDWPPALSALLAAMFWAGLESVWAAKALILLFAGAGLLLTYGLFKREERSHPLVVCLLFGLLPISFLMGTRIMAEWPFTAISFLFLILLDLLSKKKRNVAFAFLTGAVLGLSALTRWVGMFLGVAVIAQACTKMKSGRGLSRFRQATPEAIVALTGGAIWGLWRLKLTLQLLAGTAAPSENWGPLNAIVHFDPIAQLGLFNDLYFEGLSLFQYLGIPHYPTLLALTLPVLITVLGMALHFRSDRLKPADWYVLTTLIILMFYSKIKYTRYLLPIAPFLIDYLFTGLAAIAGKLKPGIDLWSTKPLKAFLIAWISLLVILNGHLLIYGNHQKTFSGLCFLVSPDPETFYLGRWRELYQICRLIKEDAAPGPVAVIGGTGGIGKYILAFSGRSYAEFPPKEKVHFVVARDSTNVSEYTQKTFGLRPIKKAQTLTLFRMDSGM